jgi:hypothetical protein
MSQWASAAEAMAYFGVDTLEELEDIVVEFDIDTVMDPEGRLIGVGGVEELKEALFERYRRKVGHRPDDPVAHEAAVELHHEVQRQMKEARKAERRSRLDRRVKARQTRARKAAEKK